MIPFPLPHIVLGDLHKHGHGNAFTNVHVHPFKRMYNIIHGWERTNTSIGTAHLSRFNTRCSSATDQPCGMSTNGPG